MLRDSLLGKDPFEIESIWQQNYRRYTYLGPRGLPTVALSGIDIALWDIKGKALGVPVYELLGGRTRDKVVCYPHNVEQSNINDLIAFHRSHGKLATITAVRPPARYGHMRFDGDQVTAFEEKPQTAEGWINGAFFVLEPEVFDYIEGDMVRLQPANSTMQPIHVPASNVSVRGRVVGVFRTL